MHERREVTKNAASAALELKKVKDEASSALLEKQEQLETAIYAIHAAEVSGTAALELIKHEKQLVREAVAEKEILTKKWARDWHKSTDRHKAADVACLAVRAELSRVEYAFDEKFNEAEKAADAKKAAEDKVKEEDEKYNPKDKEGKSVTYDENGIPSNRDELHTYDHSDRQSSITRNRNTKSIL